MPLKGPHPRILLTVVVLDANSGVHLVVYAVVEAANRQLGNGFVKI